MLTNQMLVDKTGMSISEFVRRGATDFKFWAESLFPSCIITPFHLEWVDMFFSNERSCVIAFRGSGKSTLLGVYFTLWVAFYERGKTLLIVSHNMRDSTKLVRETRKNIQQIELLYQRLAPQDRSHTWTKTEMNTATECRILSKPYSDMARSDHAHYILLDEASLFVDLTIYEEVIIPMIGRFNGHIMVIGTPKSEVDLLTRLKAPGSRYIVKEYPVMDSKGNPVWAEIFPKEKLDNLKKDQGAVAFSREYMLELRGNTEQAIKNDQIIRTFDDNMSLISSRDTTGTGLYFMGCDLAMSPDGDYSVYVVIEKTKDDHIILRSIDRLRGMDPESQARVITDIYNRFMPVTIYVDESTFGMFLVDRLQSEYHVPARPFKFDSYSRNSIVGSVVGLFNPQEGKEPRITIPRNLNDAKTSAMTNQLWVELTSVYPSSTRTGLDTYKTVSANDDCLMALGLALRAAEEIKFPKMYIKSA